jgi:threonyl-tRNA synthetase
MVICGEKERAAGNISVRQHKKGDLGALSLSDFLSKIKVEIKNKLY